MILCIYNDIWLPKEITSLQPAACVTASICLAPGHQLPLRQGSDGRTVGCQQPLHAEIFRWRGVEILAPGDHSTLRAEDFLSLILEKNNNPKNQSKSPLILNIPKKCFDGSVLPCFTNLLLMN